jgi:anthranilate 1,2-dioxygenase large subunit
MQQETALPTAHHSWTSQGRIGVPAWIYTDPAIYRKELDTFHLGPTWNFVALECEIPEPGSFKRTWIGDKQVIVNRGLLGEINVLENRCAHRGTAVCWEDSGSAKNLICPYHQWQYDLSGKLISVPFQRGLKGKGGMSKDFDKANHSMNSLVTFVHGGAVWASFDRNPPPFEKYCGEEIFRDVSRVFSGRPLRLIGHSRQLLPCNWKLYYENTRDVYHATLLHTFYVSFGLFRADSHNVRVAALEDGRHHTSSTIITELKSHATAQADSEMKRFRADLRLHDMETVTARREFAEVAGYGLQVFPSSFIQTNLNVFQVRQIVPRSPSTTELIWTFFGFADDDEEMKRLRLKQANLVGAAGFVSMDDSEVLSQVQRTVAAYPESDGIMRMGWHDETHEDEDTVLTETQLRKFYDFYRSALAL